MERKICRFAFFPETLRLRVSLERGRTPPQFLAFLSWREFGWRLHSRLGVDFRKKGAEVRRRLYSYQDIYVTLIKLDFMCGAPKP